MRSRCASPDPLTGKPESAAQIPTSKRSRGCQLMPTARAVGRRDRARARSLRFFWRLLPDRSRLERRLAFLDVHLEAHRSAAIAGDERVLVLAQRDQEPIEREPLGRLGALL